MANDPKLNLVLLAVLAVAVIRPDDPRKEG
jgi:hypothetical protein